MNEFDKIWNQTMGCGACDVKPSEDCVSREAVLELAKKGILVSNDNYKCVVNAIKSLPSVTPTNADTREAYLKGYDYGVKDWFKSKTQPTEAVSREAVEEITFQEPSYTDPYNILTEVREKVRALPTVTSERPKGKWIPVSERLPEVGEKVLCQCQANIYEVLKLTADGWYHDKNHCYMLGFVVAWMPLPDMYEEDAE